MSRKRLRWLVGLLSLGLLAGLAWLLVRTPDPDAATAIVMEAAAERWWRPGASARAVPEAEWPPELRRLGPKAVRVAPQGVFIPFGSLFVEEWGLFVLPTGSDYRPEDTTDPSFRPLRGRVYKYRIAG